MALNLGAGISQGYSSSGQSSGSTNSAQSYNNSFNTAQSMNEAMSQSASGTMANEARAWSAAMADLAWERDMQAFQKQLDFNREEAQKQRDWQAKMANTIYTRSVKNMRQAGINPILAANMGLSGAAVGTGATASIAGSPSAPLAQNFMDSWSGSSSYSHGSSSSYGYGNGESWGEGSSWGSGWSNSEEGIVTALEGLAGMADTALAGINAGQALEQMGGSYATNFGEKIGDAINQYVTEGVRNVSDQISNFLGGSGGGHNFGSPSMKGEGIFSKIQKKKR